MYRLIDTTDVNAMYDPVKIFKKNEKNKKDFLILFFRKKKFD